MDVTLDSFHFSVLNCKRGERKSKIVDKILGLGHTQGLGP